jgi:outer membrane protein insertion porin family
LQDTSSFDIERKGGRVRTGYRITENLSESWRYTFRITDISSVASDASSLIRDQQGSETLSELGHTIAYDRRDNIIKPTSGYVLKLETEGAGLGGTLFHLRNTATSGVYYPLADRWVLSARGKFGYIAGLGEDVALSERYFLGGEDVRGFATAGSGPRDIATDDALGGEWLYAATFEMTFPTGLPDEFGVGGRVFTDLGSSGKLSPVNASTRDVDSLRMGMGAGITWESPFGPLGIDLAVPLLKEDFDRTEYVRVNFGTRF